MTKLSHLLLLCTFGLFLSFVRPIPPQEMEGPTERVPNYDLQIPESAYPRWLTYTRVHPTLVPAVPPPAGQNPLQPMFGSEVSIQQPSLGVDSRGVVHVADLVFGPPSGGVVGPVMYVAYYNSRPDSRRSNGFSEQVVLYTNTPDDMIGSWPDLWVDNMDNVHVVWQVVRPRNFPSGTVTGSDIVYRTLNQSGWTPALGSQPTNLTNATISPSIVDNYSFPQVVTDSVPSFHVNCAFQRSAGGPATYDLLDIRPDNVREILPDMLNGSQIMLNAWSWRSTVGRSPNSSNSIYITTLTGSGAVSWGRTGDAWSQPMLYAPAANYGVPDVAVDSLGTPHFVYQVVTAGNPPTSAVWYQTGANQSLVAAQGVSGRILLDSRDQPHVLYGVQIPADPQNPGTEMGSQLAYAARVKNPNPTALGTMWHRQEPIASPLMDHYRGNVPWPIPPPPGQSYSEPRVAGMWLGPTDAWITSNDVIHVLDINCSYTRTMDYGLGVRDSMAMTGAFPSGLVNVTNGNLHIDLGLFSTRGVTPTQSLSLIYNSLETNAGNSSVGLGWKLSADAYLIDHYLAINNPNGGYIDQEYESITVFMPDGRPIHFRFNTTLEGPSASFLIADDEFGCFASLQRTSWNNFSPEYQMTFKSGDIWTFNSNGRLRQVRDAASNCIDFTYVNGLLAAITDQKTNGGSGGRPTSLNYEPNQNVYCPRVTAITDPVNGVYTLGYNGKHLASVHFMSGPNQPTWSFQYDNVNNAITQQRINLMHRFSPPRGTDSDYGYTCRYLQDNRIVEVEDPQAPVLPEFASDSSGAQQLSPKMKLRFVEPPGAQAQLDSFLTSRRQGNGGAAIETQYRFDRRRGLIEELHDPYSGQNGVGYLTRVFNEYSLLYQETDRYGCLTQYQYFTPNPLTPHVRDNLQNVQRTNPAGGALQTVAEYTYQVNSQFTRLNNSTVSARSADESTATSRVTSYQYDSAGRVISITHPSVTRPDGAMQSASTGFEYQGTRGAMSRVINEMSNGTTYSSFHAVHGLPLSALSDGGTQAVMMDYDIMGNQLSVTAAQGGSNNTAPLPSAVLLDGMYRIEYSIDAAGQTTSFEYDLDSNCTSVQPPAGGATTTTYDQRGFISGGSTPDGSWTQLVDAGGLVQRATNFRGHTTNYDYDSLGRLTETRSPGGSTGGGGGGPAIHTTQMTYDTISGSTRQSTTTQVGPTNRVTTTTYDILGRVTFISHPDGATRTDNIYNELYELVAVETRYNSALQRCVVSLTDHRGRLSGTRKQEAAFQFGQSAPAGSRTSWFIMDASGAVVQRVGPRGDVTSAVSLTDKVTFVRDMRGRAYEVQRPHLGQMVTVEEILYGDDDLPTETRMPNPNAASPAMVTNRRYSYTGRKELKTSFDADNLGITYAYSSLPGQVDTATNAGGVITKTTYHSSTQRPNEVIAGYGLENDRRTISTWTNGLLTQTSTFNPQTGSFAANHQRVYDAAGRLERLTAPQLQPEVITYNAFGEVATHQAGSATVTHEYNNLGQNTDSVWSGAYSDSITKGYDGLGNLSLLSDGVFHKEWICNPLSGLLTMEVFYRSGLVWKAHDYEYDASDNLIQMVDGQNNVHVWVYDDDNRLIGIRNQGAEVRTLTYRRGGQLEMCVLRNAQGSAIAQTVYTYDIKGRLVRSLTTNSASGATLADLRWEYDSRNRAERIRYFHLNVVTDIGYNFNDEVTSEVTTGSGSVPSRSASYTYDRGGNRTGQTIDGVSTTFTYNSASQLASQSRSGFSVAHVYDTWGNEDIRTTSSGGTTTIEDFNYNYLNRLAGYEKTVGSSLTAQWSYQFWATGERAGKTNVATSASSLYATSTNNVVADYNRSSAGAITLANTYAQGTGLDQKSLRIPDSGTRIHYIGDMVGTLAMTLTDTGTVGEQCIRDVWGNSFWGNTNNERYGFAQREHDSTIVNSVEMESGLVYMRHRMYDPTTGRFTQTDPILGNRPSEHYRYAANNPLSFCDPMGLDVWSIGRIQAEGVGGMKGSDFAQTLLYFYTRLADTTDNAERELYQEYIGIVGDAWNAHALRSYPSTAKMFAMIPVNTWIELHKPKEPFGLMEETVDKAVVRGENVFKTHREGGASKTEAAIHTALMLTSDATGPTDFFEAVSGIDTNRMMSKGDVSSTLRWEEKGARFGLGLSKFGGATSTGASLLSDLPSISITFDSAGSNLGNMSISRRTYLYQKVDANEGHLKFGITDNPSRRYNPAQLNGGRLRILGSGSRARMAAAERRLHETLPLGPEEYDPFFYRLQESRGLANPPPTERP